LVSKTIPELDAAGLRKFAYTSSALLVVLFGLLIPWVFKFELPVWPWIAGGVLAAWGTVAPSSLNPVYKLWMRFGLIMNRITTPIILGIVFFLVFAPIAVAMRLLFTTDSDAETYRIISTVHPSNKMERPY